MPRRSAPFFASLLLCGAALAGCQSEESPSDVSDSERGIAAEAPDGAGETAPGAEASPEDAAIVAGDYTIEGVTAVPRAEDEVEQLLLRCSVAERSGDLVRVAPVDR